MVTGKKLQVGLIGANVSYGWSPRAHIPALKSLPNIELAAICTAHENTAKISAEKYDVPLAYWNHHELLSNPDIDMVGVITRVPLHYDLTMDALRAKKPVYTEWPLGSNLSQARDMAELAASQNVPTLVGLQARQSPQHLYIQKLISDGFIGEVLSVNLKVINSGVLTRPSDRTWQKDITLGANTLTISFGHAIDALCMSLGEFEELAATVTTQIPQWYETDTNKYVDVTSPDNIAINGTLSNGAIVSAHTASIPYLGSGMKMEIYGKDGTLVLETDGSAQMGGMTLFGGQKEDKQLAVMDIPSNLITAPETTFNTPSFNVAQMWIDFGKNVTEGTKPTPDFNDALIRHKLIEAINISNSENRKVKISEIN
ncbi:MAG: Gfo/Idh/MocA family oxidoreductase [SAR202 cluster bacterium]|nr:Gfo/Idh/MocA family oxidoreductase [SAR202 cluster bacterium]|tara:strand:- start:16360 stop:17472 length:1113 start_codon:yes stop_codon:yes gene_type:complete